MQKVGERIRKLRELRNYTQEYIADKLEISQQQYSNIEKGLFDISLKKLYKISEVLEVSPATILEFDAKYIFQNNAPNYTNQKTVHNNFPLEIKKLYEEHMKLQSDKIKLLEEKILWLENQNKGN
ncbi:DNA-binding transcriptional regulator, XRE-family HTH domain [Flexibacter flexilis DSM 6793]|uniref:DNA-binding transcriptional regulator, XRE-family HTH domain n=1 Tax=Flexibacter flexilis DSM 6793 TaxID=927664 RepID=A0A1I1NUV4_9BACT|nr:helix-turn-helix domain-containing protein [Flexibacter flexilis]SFD01186.1 DNA-binding transcriptional regulator, XRE-family HTH domain [Flexibacter flexilis DSM 6793]